MRKTGKARKWAYEEFGHAELSDARRTSRLVHMTAAAALKPGGTVLDVFRSSVDRHGTFRASRCCACPPPEDGQLRQLFRPKWERSLMASNDHADDMIGFVNLMTIQFLIFHCFFFCVVLCFFMAPSGVHRTPTKETLCPT